MRASSSFTDAMSPYKPDFELGLLGAADRRRDERAACPRRPGSSGPGRGWASSSGCSCRSGTSHSVGSGVAVGDAGGVRARGTTASWTRGPPPGLGSEPGTTTPARGPTSRKTGSRCSCRLSFIDDRRGSRRRVVSRRARCAPAPWPDSTRKPAPALFRCLDGRHLDGVGLPTTPRFGIAVCRSKPGFPLLRYRERRSAG